MAIERSGFGVSVITGAAGGVGLATARLLGRQTALLITDLQPERVAATVALLRDEGYAVEGIAGDLADPATISELVSSARNIAPLRTLINAAGLSPVLAGWRAILKANIVGAERLLQGFEPLLVQGSAAVMVCSVAGHLGPRDEIADRLLTDPLQDGLFQAIESRLQAVLDRVPGTIEGHAYSFSKRALMRSCVRRAVPWGAKGARINSISPGGIWTPMGRAESESGKRVNALIESTPAQRWGTAMDMASAIEFLVSPQASYITGTDLRIDGGSVAALGDAIW